MVNLARLAVASSAGLLAIGGIAAIWTRAKGTKKQGEAPSGGGHGGAGGRGRRGAWGRVPGREAWSCCWPCRWVLTDSVLSSPCYSGDGPSGGLLQWQQRRQQRAAAQVTPRERLVADLSRALDLLAVRVL